MEKFPFLEMKIEHSRNATLTFVLKNKNQGQGFDRDFNVSSRVRSCLRSKHCNSRHSSKMNKVRPFKNAEFDGPCHCKGSGI